MANITYLLGAGASFDALPIVEKIPERLASFASQFKIYDFEKVIKDKQQSNIAEKHLFRFDNLDAQRREYEKIKKFYEDIIWLKVESKNHSSIDTFAKKLYLKNDSNLKKLKYILSCFFLYEQTRNFDNRYDSFFASILESITEIPKNLKIISWNYDSQLEIAFSNFTDYSIEKSREVLNVLSKGDKIQDDLDINKFTVFKVNGTTNVSNKTEGLYDIIPDFKVTQESLVGSFLEIYSSQILWRSHESRMSFAWEKPEEDSIYKLRISGSIRNTDILVVIGYSFPFFNRKTDKFILNSMRNLKKVYVQDPNNAEDIIEKIKGFFPNSNKNFAISDPKSIEFIPQIFKDQFFIPIEF